MTDRTYPHGVPSWVDTGQPDVDAATQFYGGLFGWTFEEAMPPGAPARYVIAKLDGKDVAAIAGPGEGTAPWNTYVAVDDVDGAVSRLVSVALPSRPARTSSPSVRVAGVAGLSPSSVRGSSMPGRRRMISAGVNADV